MLPAPPSRLERLAVPGGWALLAFWQVWSISSGANPPSGPMNKATDVGFPGRGSNVWLSAGDSAVGGRDLAPDRNRWIVRPPLPDRSRPRFGECVPYEIAQPLRLRSFAIASVSSHRPVWPRMMLRDVWTGMNRQTPTSVPFCKTHSNFSRASKL